MNAIRRPVPRSLTPEVTSLIVVATLLSIGIATFILILSAEEPHSPGVPGGSLAVLAEIASMAKTPSEIETILSAARRAGLDVEVVARTELVAIPGHPIVISLNGDSALVVNREVQPETFPRFLVLPSVLTLSFILVFVGLLSVYGIRWITRPLSAIAAAAESFGRFPADDVALSENGPREIATVAVSMNHMRKRIRSLLEQRTGMLSAISHDIRTPLTRLRLRAERLPDSAARDGIYREVDRIDSMLQRTSSPCGVASRQPLCRSLGPRSRGAIPLLSAAAASPPRMLGCERA